MRKSKEIKRKRVNAGVEYKRGNRKDAYKMWTEAKKEIEELRRPAPAPQKEAQEGATA